MTDAPKPLTDGELRLLEAHAMAAGDSHDVGVSPWTMLRVTAELRHLREERESLLRIRSAAMATCNCDLGLTLAVCDGCLIRELTAERDAARAWARRWKRCARYFRRRDIGYSCGADRIRYEATGR